MEREQETAAWQPVLFSGTGCLTATVHFRFQKFRFSQNVKDSLVDWIELIGGDGFYVQ